MLQEKALLFIIKTSKNISNLSLRSYHYTLVLNKKAGIFSDVNKKDLNKTATKTVTKKVKLYPGFQDSVEEINKLTSSNKSQDSFLAKKMIEDFYGLHELEFDDQKTKKENETYQEVLDESTEFDVEAATKILESLNVRNICCIEIPKEMNYANYMIIGTCLSEKHLNSSFMSINKKYKLLKNNNSKFLRRKLSDESKWCALDTGHIIIHLFLPDAREFYDLETLWACGAELDEKCLSFTKEQYLIEQKLLVVED